MSLVEAEELLCNTVISCYNTNKRCILFVTGKGVNKKEADYRNETRLYYGKIRINRTEQNLKKINFFPKKNM